MVPLPAVQVRVLICFLASCAAITQAQAPQAAKPPLRDCAAIASHDEQLKPLSIVCESVKAMRGTLPNFVCEQSTERHRGFAVRRGRQPSRDTVLDTITATVTFSDGVNYYDNIRVGDKAVDGKMFDIAGLTSTGEFGSDLVSIFLEQNAAVFRFRERTKTLEGEALVFGFYVPAATNHTWILQEKNASTRPRLEGAVWVHRLTNRVLRVDVAVSDIDPHFDTETASRRTVYGEVHLPDLGDFLLPTRSEATACTRDQVCTRNTTGWQNCKRFAGKARVVEKIE